MILEYAYEIERENPLCGRALGKGEILLLVVRDSRQNPSITGSLTRMACVVNALPVFKLPLIHPYQRRRGA